MTKLNINLVISRYAQINSKQHSLLLYLANNLRCLNMTANVFLLQCKTANNELI